MLPTTLISKLRAFAWAVHRTPHWRRGSEQSRSDADFRANWDILWSLFSCPSDMVKHHCPEEPLGRL